MFDGARSGNWLHLHKNRNLTKPASKPLPRNYYKQNTDTRPVSGRIIEDLAGNSVFTPKPA